MDPARLIPYPDILPAPWWLFYILLAPTAWWYLRVIPLEARAVISDPDLTVDTVRRVFMVLTPLLFLAGLFMALRLPKSFQQGFSFFLMFLAFLYLGFFLQVPVTP